MASSYTGLGTELMTTGENAGVWGTTTNTNLQIIEQISGGYTEQDIGGSADTTTLSVSDGSTGAVLGHRIIKFTGTITGNQIVTIPLDVQQMYVLVNGTSGAYTVQFKYASGSGSSVTFAATDKGTKIVYATADHATNPNLVDTGISSTGAHDLDGNEFILDADADTSITADTDDQIDIRIAGADDFQFTANTFTAQAGSTIAAQALTATTVTASGIVKTDDTTEATTTTDGSLQTDGGLSVAKDAVFGDDVKLLSDSAVLSFGADSDTTLTHTDGTGLTLNSTNKLLFRDTGLYINSSTDGQLDLVADTEIQIAATTIDINGAIAMDGAITGATNITLSGELDSATLDVSGNADIDGTTNLDIVDIDGAVQIDGAVTVGVDGTGLDVKFFGDTSGSFLLWDQSDDALELTDSSPIKIGDAGDMQVYHDGTNSYITNSEGALKVATETSGIAVTIGHTTSEVTVADNLTVTGTLTLGSNAELTEAELELLDGLTAGTAIASKVVTTDSSIDTTGQRNLTISGELDAATLDISGNADIDGTTNLDAVDIDGAVQLDATLTIGADDQGYDVIFYGDAASANMTWDTSVDDLILNGAARIVIPDGQLVLGSTAVTSTAAEVNLIDGGTSRGTTAVASGDGLLVNDGGTMRMTNVDTVSTYFASHSVGGGNIVTTGALDSGSITSGFGAIDNGTSGIRTNTFTAETSILPDASGGADIGSTSAEWGDIFIADDKAIKFGSGQDVSVEYDEDGTDSLLISGGDVTIVDDKKLYFGTGQDVYLEYDEDGTDKLIIKGNTTFLDGSYDFDIASHDTSNGLKLGGTLVSATAAELNYSDLATLGTSAASKVLSADSNNLTKITGGVYLEEDTLSFDATQDWDVRASPVAQVTLTANVTFDLPSNPTTGQYISILCIQDGTGSRTIAWNAAFEFTGGTAPTATTTAGKGDLFTFRYHNSHWIEVGRNLNLTRA